MLLKIESNHNLPFVLRSKLTLLVSRSKYPKVGLAISTEGVFSSRVINSMAIIPFIHFYPLG